MRTWTLGNRNNNSFWEYIDYHINTFHNSEQSDELLPLV